MAGDQIQSLLDKLKDRDSKETQLSREIVDTLFSDDTNKVLKTARLTRQELQMVQFLELHQSFLVEDFCYTYKDDAGVSVDMAAKFRSLLDKFLIATNAIDGKAFDTMMAAAQAQAAMSQLVQNPQERRIL